MNAKGQMLRCDRCGEIIFSEYVETIYQDGGFTAYEVFAKPEGWSTEFIDCKKVDFCPSCTQLFGALKEKHEQELRQFMKEDQHGE